MAGLFEIEPVDGLRTGRPGDRGGPARAEAQRAARAVGRQAPLARRATPACRARSPGWCRTTPTTMPQFFRADDASEEIAARRRAGFERLSRAAQRRGGAHARAHRRGRPAHLGPAVHRELSRALPVQPARQGRSCRRAPSSPSRRACRSPISTATPATTSPAPTASTCWATTSTRAAWSAARPRVAELGPVLGHYPSLVADNAARLARISGKAEVSFHMSGTEAVMQAVRLARYHTGRSPCRGASAAPITAGGATCSPASATRCRRTRPTPWPTCRSATLAVLRTRRDIACVLVNPVQAMYPNIGAPADSTLVASRPDRASIAPPTRPG